MRSKIVSLSVLLGLCVAVNTAQPVWAMSNVSDIEQGNLDTKQVGAGQGNLIYPDHWSYKLVKELLAQSGLDKTENNIRLDGTHPITRTEMAVLIADLTGAVVEPGGTSNLGERQKAQFEILQEEFNREVGVIKARIEKVEGSVQTLSQQVEKVQENDKAGVYVSAFGPAKLSGTLQVWNTTPFDSGQTDKNFRLRRAEVTLEGDLTEGWEYEVEIDPTRSSNILKDLVLEYEKIPHHSIRIGQFKPGVTWEGSLSSARIPLIERSQIGRIGDEREQGLAMFGNWKYMDYRLGIYNGNGENNRDTNDRLAPGGRITLKPLVGLIDEEKWGRLELGSSFLDGQAGSGSTLEERDRFGLEARYIHPKFSILSEYLYLHEEGVPGAGWYLMGLYNLTPKWQLAARYDTLDSERGVPGNTRDEFTAGINYFIERYNIRLALNYLLFQDESDTNEGSAIRFLAQHVF